MSFVHTPLSAPHSTGVPVFLCAASLPHVEKEALPMFLLKATILCLKCLQLQSIGAVSLDLRKRRQISLL